MKQILLFVAMLVLASYVGAMAETYEVDGIYYTTSLDAVSAMQVTHGPNGTGSYSGNVVVPERVTIDGHSYQVAAIDNGAFANCSSLSSVTLPNTIKRRLHQSE